MGFIGKRMIFMLKMMGFILTDPSAASAEYFPVRTPPERAE